jgi:SAM-dependent methyltransferase
MHLEHAIRFCSFLKKMQLKRLLKKILPNSLEVKFRQMFYLARGFYYRGGEYQCPCCETRIRRFISGGVESRPNAQCPRCGSLERHRLLFLYLKHKTDFFSQHLRVFDIAPSYSMQQKFMHSANLDYLSTSLDDSWAMTHLDITSLPLPDNHFDCILCYHVLEHIADDLQAMRELLRVLKPHGWAILQSPIDTTRETTLENAQATTPEARRDLFGQEDHVRIYGRDYIERMKKAGFVVTQDTFVQDLSDKMIDNFGLMKEEVLFICKKPFIS